MRSVSKQTLWIFLLALAAGSGLHFLYSGIPSVVTAVFAPINESIWEHIKLLYWPALIGGWFLERYKKNWGGRCAGVLLGAGLMQVVGWLYHIRLGGSALWVDLLLYAAAMGIAFFLPEKWEIRGKWTIVLTAAVVLLGGAILWFTFDPPLSFALFREGG